MRDYWDSDDVETAKPLVCDACHLPAFYDDRDERRHHAVNASTGCFLIPAEDRPDDRNHPYVEDENGRYEWHAKFGNPGHMGQNPWDKTPIRYDNATF